MPPRPEISNPLLDTLLGGALLLIILLLLICGWFLAKQRLLAVTLAVLAALLGIALLARLHELLVLVLLAAALAFILDRPIQRLDKRMPRPLAIAAVYLGVVVVLAGIGALIVPRLVVQAANLRNDIPKYTPVFQRRFEVLIAWYRTLPPSVHNAVDRAADMAKARSEAILTGAAETLVGLVGWFVKGILALVISIYLLTDKERLRAAVFRAAPAGSHGELRDTLTEIGAALGGYLRAEFTVILFVAVSITVVLFVFGIPHALFIGIAAGVLEVIPYFGALAGAIPAVALGFSKSWIHGVGLIGAFVAINQIEGHYVMPVVMAGQLEMRPLWILLALLTGHFLFGVPGMILAVPILSILRIIIPRVYKLYRRLRHLEQEQGVAIVE